MKELPIPSDLERYGILNPEKLASYFGKTAIFGGYDTYLDENDNEIGDFPFWIIRLESDDGQNSLELFVTPDLKEVSAVSRGLAGVSSVSEVTRVEVSATGLLIHARFISVDEDGNFRSTLDVNSGGTFYSSSGSRRENKFSAVHIKKAPLYHTTIFTKDVRN